MKKLLILFLSTIILLFSLTGCEENNRDYSENKPEYGPQFMLLEEYDDPYLGKTYILVDKNSRVIYLYLHPNADKTDSKALTVLYDSKGNVRRYSGVILE